MWIEVAHSRFHRKVVLGRDRPDGVRVEIHENTSIATPMQMHRLHLMLPDPAAAQRWYGEHFGAMAGTRVGGVAVVRTTFTTANVPGAEITLSQAATPLEPTMGPAIDHIGFEVRDIGAIVAHLRALGLALDDPVLCSRVRREDRVSRRSVGHRDRADAKPGRRLAALILDRSVGR